MPSAYLLALTVLATAGERDTILPPSVAGFRAEHAALLQTFASRLRDAVAPTATRSDRAGLVLFLRADLLPHARVEELVLYPALDSVLGTRGSATLTMVMDHQVIARTIDELAALTGTADPAQFNRRAYALEALIASHFAKEEEFALPALRERLSEPELHRLFDRMEALKVRS